MPDDLELFQHQKFGAKRTSLRYQQDTEQSDLIEEARMEYLYEIYKQTDRVWGGCRTVTMRYSQPWSDLRLMSIDATSLPKSQLEEIKPKQLTLEGQRLLQTTLAMREALHPREKTKAEKAIDFIPWKAKPTILKLLGQRAALCLQGINLGEQQQILFFDDTYKLEAFNIQENQVVGSLPINSYQLKCLLIAETKLFVGLTIGEIHMFDPFTLERLGKVEFFRNALPSSMALYKSGSLLVGTSNSSLEVFNFSQQTIQTANPIVNEIKVPYTGEIYSI